SDDDGNTWPHMFMQHRDIETMFNPEGPLAFNIFRIHIFPVSPYFPEAIDHILDGTYLDGLMMPSNAFYTQFVQMVNNFGGYVVAAPWTPPVPEWKHNNHLYGTGTSNLRREFYGAYAAYLRNWAQEMANREAPLFAISLQNEPTFPANYYGMLWTQQEHRDFLAYYGDVIIRANDGAGVPGFGGGRPGRVMLQGGTPHNDVTWNNAALNHPVARRNLEIVGYHTYGAWNVRYPLALDSFPRRETWMMEKNVNAHAAGGAMNDSTWNMIWVVMNEIHHVIAHNDSSVYTWWYLKRFYSMIGEGAFGTTNGAILPRGYGMGHFSRFLTDTVRLDAYFQGGLANAIGGGAGRLLPGVIQNSPGEAGIRAVAGMRTSNPTTDVELGLGFGSDELDERFGGLKVLEDSVSVLLSDSRVATDVQGQSSTIRVLMPAGFTADSAHGMISASTGQRHAPVLVTLEADGASAIVELPVNSMISLRFHGEWD
ncbi:MAG: hypothetical protein FWD88_07445, partial [Treponema sp.]|nr:hypothetical protein [Treponema sp.]